MPWWDTSASCFTTRVCSASLLHAEQVQHVEPFIAFVKDGVNRHGLCPLIGVEA